MATKAAERARELYKEWFSGFKYEADSPENRVLADAMTRVSGKVFTELLTEALTKHEAATIERCAQIAESEKVDYESTKAEGDLAYNSAIEHCGDAIRAMKGE